MSVRLVPVTTVAPSCLVWCFSGWDHMRPESPAILVKNADFWALLQNLKFSSCQAQIYALFQTSRLLLWIIKFKSH